MKRILTICALMAVLTGCRCQVAQPGRLSADSTEYIVTIEGRKVAFPLALRSENTLLYYRCESFTEHDTLFLDREYNFYRCDTCRETELTTSNYFLTPRTDPNHDKTVRDNFSVWDREKDKEYFDVAYTNIFAVDSTAKLIPQNLGDIPRVWYPLLKREGRYFLSIDSPYPFEFTDSLIVFLGMEIYMSPLKNFRKISDDEYCYDYTVGSGTWYHVSLRRSSKNRDLWLEVVTSPDDEHFILYNAYTPLECIGSFDYINYRSDDHIPEGLCNYEKTSPEDF